MSLDGNAKEEGLSSSANDPFEDNFENHPLLNNLVMDTLFKQYSSLKHDGSTALAALAKLRGVCKTWNDEIGKMVRKKTHIDVGRIVTAYPEGLGWEANVNGFNYSVPMPEKIGTFENIDLIITRCADLTSSSIIQWFQVMGSSVRSLRLKCPLTCYHQNRFIEKILKEWCPNLSSFTLKGAWCFESLVLNSFFAKQTLLHNQCGSLKEFVFDADNTCWNQWMESCGEKIQHLDNIGEELPATTTLESRMKMYKRHSKFVDRLNNYMKLAGEPDTTPAEQEKLLKQLVTRPIGLASVAEMSPATFGSHVPEFFQQQFKCDPGYETDGGVFGQLIKMSKAEKLVIQYRQIMLFKELLSMFLFRPNLWLCSLKDFELFDNCASLTFNEQIYKVLRIVFSKLGFPVRRLKFEGRRSELNIGGFHAPTMQRILSSHAEQLEVLEINWNVLIRHGWLTFPILPKLKTLVVECEGINSMKMSIQEIVGKFPNLEQCVLKDIGRIATNLFETAPVGSVNHPLKVLKLLDGYVMNRGDIQRIVMCFPNLKIVDLSIARASQEAFNEFWVEMGTLSLEHLKLRTFIEKLSQTPLEDNIADFKDLKSMEWVHQARQALTLPSSFSKAFSKAPNLQYLKFTNFQVWVNEMKEFKENLPRCAVEISARVARSSTRIKRKLDESNK